MPNANKNDLADLPHVISVNELNPLRDKRLKYNRTLMSAGVTVYCRTVNGTCYAGDIYFRKTLPKVDKMFANSF